MTYEQDKNQIIEAYKIFIELKIREYKLLKEQQEFEQMMRKEPYWRIEFEKMFETEK